MYPFSRGPFLAVKGMIVDVTPARTNGSLDGCILYFTLEDDDGNTVNFMVTPYTFVADWKPLAVGQEAIFWYRADAPVPLIYPPQYTAAAAALVRRDRMYDVSFYDDSLINAEHTLQLHMDNSVELRTGNNQYFQGSPANHNLFVSYSSSTRSIPAQTTPLRVIVLCDELQQDN